MAKFTSGKWYANKGGYSVMSETVDVPIAIMIDRPNVLANARLIAAAPEMYKKLLDCAEFLEERGMLQCEGCSERAAELLVSVEDLLSRIDGEEVSHE